MDRQYRKGEAAAKAAGGIDARGDAPIAGSIARQRPRRVRGGGWIEQSLLDKGNRARSARSTMMSFAKSNN